MGINDDKKAYNETIEAEMASALKGIPFPPPPPRPTTDLLSDRAKTHGDFADHAAITQKLKGVAAEYPQWTKLNYMQAESLDMIFHKIGRVLAGDPDFRDHWDDIAGYAKLVADRCSK